MSSALSLLHALVMDADGHRWGERATDVQRRDAEALLDRDGPRRHWIGRSRGYAKTDDLAAVTVAVLLEQLHGGDEAIGVAADRDQARLLVDRVRWIAARTPELHGALDVDAYVVRTSAGARFEAIASDAPSSWGRSPAWAVVDELCQHADTASARQVFEAISTGIPKVRGRLAVISTAGSPSHWSRAVYENALADPGWRVSDVHGPAPWLDSAEVEGERRRLPESSFRRLFQNEWTDAEDALATLEDVRACVHLPGPLEPVPGTTYTVGLDLGLKRDRTVAAICHADRRDNGVVVVLDRMCVWQGRRLKPVRLGDVEEWLAAESKRYNSARIVADPWQSVGMAQRLRVAGVKVEEFVFSSTSVGRLAATLHTAIRDHRIVLPDDEELISELASIRLRETSPGVLRMDTTAGKHDDRGVALALACHEYVEKGLGTGKVWLDWMEAELRERESQPDAQLSAIDRQELARLPHSAPFDRPAAAPVCVGGASHRFQKWPQQGWQCMVCGGWRDV